MGDLVYSVNEGALAVVPISRVGAKAQSDHMVVEVILENDSILQISPTHPTADGRTFGDLTAGDALDVNGDGTVNPCDGHSLGSSLATGT